MTDALAPLEEVGSRAWLERTGGHLTQAERAYLLRGMFPMILEGFRLRRRARASARRGGSLEAFAPPQTPMVAEARELLLAQASAPMVQHCFRTGYWTLAVLSEKAELTPQLVETAWVAALLHDLGLDRPTKHGDFSAGGVALLESLAVKHHWSDAQVNDAAQAITVNLTTRADPSRFGLVAWAMNVGGAGELGIWPHRAQLARNRIVELEALHPRAGFRAVALKLIRDEVERIPDGRFALFQPIYWLLMR